MNEQYLDQDPLADNLTRLLQRTRPDLVMPEADKTRVLAALTARPAAGLRFITSKKKSRLTLYSYKLWVPAAALLLVAVFLAWPLNRSENVVWAQVQSRLAHIRSYQYYEHSTVIEKGKPFMHGQDSVECVFHLSPRKTRTDIFAKPQKGFDPYRDSMDTLTPVISYIDRDNEWIAIDFKKKTVQVHKRINLRPIASKTDPPQALLANYKGEIGFQRLLARLESQDAQPIGNRTLNGFTLDGFQLSWTDAGARGFNDHSGRVMSDVIGGCIRVWVSRQTGWPLEIEYDELWENGWRRVSYLQNIMWNPALPPELFELGASTANMAVTTNTISYLELQDRKLKPGTPFIIRLADGTEIGCADDLASFIYIQAENESNQAMWAEFYLRGDVFRRWSVLSKNTQDKQMYLDFDHVRVGSLWINHPSLEKEDKITACIGIDKLGLNVFEFEAKYLTEAANLPSAGRIESSTKPQPAAENIGGSPASPSGGGGPTAVQKFSLRLDIKPGQATSRAIKQLTSQTIAVLEKRLQGYGLRPDDFKVTQSAPGRITVNIYGEGRNIDVLMQRDKLEFRFLSPNSSDFSSPEQIYQFLGGKLPDNCEILEFAYPTETGEQRFTIVEKTPIITGADITNAESVVEDPIRPKVNFTLQGSVSARFGEATAKNIGRRLAIVLDGKVLAAPQIMSRAESGCVTGLKTTEEAETLAINLRAGALPVGVILEKQKSSK